LGYSVLFGDAKENHELPTISMKDWEEVEDRFQETCLMER